MLYIVFKIADAVKTFLVMTMCWRCNELIQVHVQHEAFVWFLRVELLEGLPRRLCEQDPQTTVSEHTVCCVGERGDRKDFLYFQQYSNIHLMVHT